MVVEVVAMKPKSNLGVVIVVLATASSLAPVSKAQNVRLVLIGVKIVTPVTI